MHRPFLSWFVGNRRRVAPRAGRRAQPRIARNRRRPIVEMLEERALLAGNLIAFTSALNLTPNADERGGIMIMQPDGTGVRQLTTFHTLNYEFGAHGLHLPDDHPAVSPDGQKIAFTSSRDAPPEDREDFEIYLMDINGANVRQLTNSPGIDTEPVFSPDGSKIAWSSERAGNLDIWVMNVDGSNPQQLTFDTDDEIEPAFSPDGSLIAYTKVPFSLASVAFNQKNIFIMNADGSNQRRLTNAIGEEHDPSFSPDGGKLVITSEQALIPSPPFGDVFIINASDGSVVDNLTPGVLTGAGDPAWSPDGGQIAYFSARFPVITSPMDLFVMNADGSNKTHLPAPGLLNIHPNWGIAVDSDNDGVLDYLENSNLSLTQAEFAAGDGAGDRFGSALALADLTHDGFPELIAGIPGENVNGVSEAGRIALVHGSPFGPDFSFDVSLGNNFLDFLPPRLDADEVGGQLQTNGRFGKTLAAGDFNGDGFTDIAVGAPGQNRVFVGYSSQTPWQVLSGAGSFGAALAAGDFNNDGRADLAVGEPTAVRLGPAGNVPSGAVRVFYGSAAGLSSSAQIFDQGSLPPVSRAALEETGDEFGLALAAGDINGDGADELAVGVPGEDFRRAVNAGLVHIIPGKTGQPLSLNQAIGRDGRNLPSPHNGWQANARFGEVLAVGDFNDDSLNAADLVVGIPAQNIGSINSAGVLAVFAGRSSFITPSLLAETATVITAADVGAATEASSRFGAALGVGDFTGEGVPDLAAAAPQQEGSGVGDAGKVFTIPGSRNSSQTCAFCVPFNPLFGLGGGLVPAAAQQIDAGQVGSDLQAQARFGTVLTAGDMDGDGQADLFIGSPRHDIDGALDSGMVGIRFGVNVGIAELSPIEQTAHPNEPVTFTLTWTHPQSWMDLETLHLRLVHDGSILTWVRFDQQSNTFSLLNPQPGKFGRSAIPSSRLRLASRLPLVDLLGTTVTDSGADGQSITLSIALRFHPLAAGLDYQVEVMATDDHGNSQGFDPIGVMRLKKRRKLN